ncbi:MAG: glycoside hydrolase family 3 C-terminal domain-containing protein [Ancrocorticia sp.]
MRSSSNPTTTEAIGSLSTLEKAALLSGQTTWQTRALPRLGVRQLWMSDGPHGIRRQAGSADHLGINASQPATCFPTSATVSNSWDPALAERLGRALGREASHLGVDVLLGPGLNIKRSPLGGRNFEYFSEDPYLAGKLAAGYVRGIQSAGVAACPKHFAVNSQETRRMTSDSVVDEATLREIYLTAFEILVKEARPLTIMTSYNLVNGTYSHENPHLLRDILRDEWGFDGAVITDWGGGNDPVAAISAGGTIEMPSPGYDSVREILEAPRLDEAQLNARVAEAVALTQRINPESVNESIFDEHDGLAQEAAEASIVLLKNEQKALPLASGTKVAVVGDFAFEPRYQGAGSSLVNPTRLVTPLQALQDSSLSIVATARGFERGKALDGQLLAEAIKAASAADIVLLHLGLDEILESEGKDREHMHLPENQVQLLERVAQVNPHVVVVLSAGSAIEMPWIDKVEGVVHGYLGGQAGARAMVRVLTGAVNPSGRLAESYARSLAETPTAGAFPVQQKHALYREGPFVGYRYYSSADVPVLFPFGYGLSYTTFAYSELDVDGEGVTFTVTNTGDVAGADVPQLYVSPPPEARKVGLRPRRELKGFEKVTLEAGESKRVRIAFDEYTFRVFDAQANRWRVIAGEYGVAIGANVDDLALESSIEVDGELVADTAPVTLIENYSAARVHDVTDAEFATLLGRTLPAAELVRVLTATSPLSDLKHAKSPVGRAIYKHYFQRSLRKAQEKGVPDLNLLFQYGMPFRAIAKMSGGLADMRMVEAILTIVNGHFVKGLIQVIVRFVRNRTRQKQLASEFEARAAGTQPLSQAK